MKAKNIYLSVLAGGLIIVAGFLIYPVFKGEAQNSPRQSNKMDETALTKLRENATASRFYEKLNNRDGDLVLARFSPPSPMENHKVINMIFRKGQEEFHVSILEYQSVEDARAPLSYSLNSDTKPYTDFGDEGRVIYDYLGKGGFAGLEYRKDRFFVSINCKDEAVAKRLAGYASETIGQ